MRDKTFYCRACKQRKAYALFPKDKSRTQGISGRCRKCDNARINSKRRDRLPTDGDLVLRIASRQILNCAVKSGRVVKPGTCSNCPSEIKIEGHHKDYAYPLDVIWLCSKCHHGVHDGSIILETSPDSAKPESGEMGRGSDVTCFNPIGSVEWAIEILEADGWTIQHTSEAWLVSHLSKCFNARYANESRMIDLAKQVGGGLMEVSAFVLEELMPHFKAESGFIYWKGNYFNSKANMPWFYEFVRTWNK